MPTVFKGGEAMRLRMAQICRELFNEEEGTMYGDVREMSKREFEEMENKAYRAKMDACSLGNGPMMATTCAPPRPPEVADALEGLRMVIQRYDGLVGRLGGRLHMVLRPAEPAVADCCAERGYQTDLAREINVLRCLARDVSDALESIIERIEV